LPNKTGIFKPKAAASSLNPNLLSGNGEVLAGKSSTYDIDWFEFFSGELLDVAIAFHVRPMLRQNPLAERIDLNLPAALHPGPF
jgi:hypothetical protein